MSESYSKYHALGNDYIVLDPRSFSLLLTEPRIRKICHRNLGLGSDGILFGPQSSDAGIPAVSIYNPDGSEAEKSGNGIRIFAKYLWDRGYATSDTLDLMTKGGRVSVRRNNADTTNLTVSMGKLTIYEERILSLNEGKHVLCVYPASIGNPHAVVIAQVGELSDRIAKEIGPLIESHPSFPQKTNVQFVTVLDKSNIRIEIWERGAGYTLASGSSSSAAAGVCYMLGFCSKEVKVHQPGGTLDILVKSDSEIELTGEVSSVAEGQFTPAFISQLLELV